MSKRIKFGVIALLLAPLALVGVELDLRPQWDATIPLANPHKGWYHHFFDNTVEKYLLESDDELTKFPGMDHIYLRLAWSYLEPAEGRFNWSVVDEPIAKWTARGLGVAFGARRGRARRILPARQGGGTGCAVGAGL
ncbi:MAG: beta-galactosidase [Kiritimatiellaeota bacterium]|nr:beta-galactosidase [Kiritimatiellota bacterium]